MPKDMPGRIPEDMPDRMPGRRPKDMSDRMPEDLPVTKRINVMVGITRSEVIGFGFLLVTFFFFWNIFWVQGHCLGVCWFYFLARPGPPIHHEDPFRFTVNLVGGLCNPLKRSIPELFAPNGVFIRALRKGLGWTPIFGPKKGLQKPQGTSIVPNQREIYQV